MVWVVVGLAGGPFGITVGDLGGDGMSIGGLEVEVRFTALVGINTFSNSCSICSGSSTNCNCNSSSDGDNSPSSFSGGGDAGGVSIISMSSKAILALKCSRDIRRSSMMSLQG